MAWEIPTRTYELDCSCSDVYFHLKITVENLTALVEISDRTNRWKRLQYFNYEGYQNVDDFVDREISKIFNAPIHKCEA